MLILVREHISPEDLKKAAEDLDGYIKFVVDLEKDILTAGGIRHVDGEQLLLKSGSKQEKLWGGGLDLETGEMDFDSMINIRPKQGNTSREVLSQDLRDKIAKIVTHLLK
jgi:hypothetical protein